MALLAEERDDVPRDSPHVLVAGLFHHHDVERVALVDDPRFAALSRDALHALRPVLQVLPLHQGTPLAVLHLLRSLPTAPSLAFHHCRSSVSCSTVAKRGKRGTCRHSSSHPSHPYPYPYSYCQHL